jgi:metal-sulfur cluster biosynthetic enzyme
MTVTTDNESARGAWGVLHGHEPRARISAADARTALRKVRGLPVLDAMSKLRRGPGPTYEPVARVLDAALARAEAAGIRIDQLVVVDGTADPGPDQLRENRKLGTGTWFTIPTASIIIALQPAGLCGSATAATAGAPTPADLVSPLSASSEHCDTQHDERAAAVRAALYEVLDPDLGVNIVDLGFVRGIVVDADDLATLTMTLTSAACPLTKIMEEQIQRVLIEPSDSPVNGFRIEWVWQPAWKPSDITEEGRDQLRAIGFTNF